MSSFPRPFGDTEGPLGFPMLDRQARELDALLKSLPGTEEYRYRHFVIAKAPTELNPGERSDVSWITTESVDRTGEVVSARGMNDGQFQANPLVTLGHAYWLPPVGRSLWRRRVKDGERQGVKAKTVYPARPDSWPADENWAPDQVFALIQSGLLNGKSIGFLPTKVHIPEDTEVQKNNWDDQVSLVIDEWLLLEYACVFLMVKHKIYASKPSPGAIPAPPTRPAGPAWGIAPPLPARTRHKRSWAACGHSWAVPSRPPHRRPKWATHRPRPPSDCKGWVGA
jgi:hypothetical protein